HAPTSCFLLERIFPAGGELLQIKKARKLDIDEDTYFEILRAKTASLLAASCAAGAYSSKNNKQDAEKFKLLGEKIGIAFQIRDDLFDYGTEQIGKPTGIDIKERKMTLPLIYALKHATFADRKRIIYIIKNNNTDRNKVNEVIEFVTQSGGIVYTRKKMSEFHHQALELLASYPDSTARQAMIELVNYSIERKY
ncbi:MAG: polyprenyl synthetase family protein, partial [Chitinophagia bacterium]|nr:polyprenyl synthetase family protein [Chitinophagia bacterium]